MSAQTYEEALKCFSDGTHFKANEVRECREKLPESEWKALTLGLEGTKLELDLIIYARPVKPVFQVGSFLMKMSDDAFKKIFLGLTVFKEAKLSIPVS